MHYPACELRRTRIRRSSQNPIYANFVELRKGEVRRIPIMHTLFFGQECETLSSVCACLASTHLGQEVETTTSVTLLL